MAICHRQLRLVTARRGRRTVLLGLSRRWFMSWYQSDDCEHVQVPCASSGSITLSLHNLARHPETTPLLVCLPPFTRSTEVPSPLPRFARPYPTVVINYRWPEETALDNRESAQSALPDRFGWRKTDDDNGPAPAPADPAPTVLHWPTPLHDVLFGYRWITENLAPQMTPRRDIYAYGSYLGASLAAALALTECDQATPMPVRGVALHNGIYDWTTFLPDHPVNHSLAQGAGGAAPARYAGNPMDGDEGLEPTFHYLKTLMPTLFSVPSNLFDPFASPCLFFHTPGFEMPPTFDRPLHADPDLDAGELRLGSSSDVTEDRRIEIIFKISRSGYETFPPSGSSLRIPSALLLHQSPKWSCKASRTGYLDSTTVEGRGRPLDSLDHRSVLLEGSRMWEGDLDAAEEEAAWRVRLRDVGPAELGDEAVEEPVAEWLEEQMRV
ncbi:hypothetical protein MAPG_11117 [Magnaporthiopsis poae ATCC 64411]|uniref:Alpha/beta hydrolase fold-3 domain-containing protein n=1 Tax=Magnaporthiopsis poae (strain ATCC 64411 / 73-15) TaxID=644358 RepID=A0A0C4EEE4_MAGP6|nr:hypothetical protein MAPG_11117 [Magnaporthiopsis poae ATCC 64411]